MDILTVPSVESMVMKDECVVLIMCQPLETYCIEERKTKSEVFCSSKLLTASYTITSLPPTRFLIAGHTVCYWIVNSNLRRWIEKFYLDQVSKIGKEWTYVAFQMSRGTGGGSSCGTCLPWRSSGVYICRLVRAWYRCDLILSTRPHFKDCPLGMAFDMESVS